MCGFSLFCFSQIGLCGDSINKELYLRIKIFFFFFSFSTIAFEVHSFYDARVAAQAEQYL